MTLQENGIELRRVVLATAAGLRPMSEAAASTAPGPGVWSPKQVLGHLIDSAANNHQRFVRAALHGEVTLDGYDADAWVDVHGYAGRAWADLIDTWCAINQQLAAVLIRIPESAGTASCRIGGGDPVTLTFLVEDYLVHMRHHLRQIGERAPVERR